MLTLAQFLYRLVFGLSLAMAVTPPSKVGSGYYRNHLYVLLGLNTAAGVLAYVQENLTLWIPVAGAAVSYAGSIIWLYERRWAGRIALGAVAILGICGAWQATPFVQSNSPLTVLRHLDAVSGGLLLGVTAAAMLLGHWYLNAPGMQLAPLRRLLVWMAAALVLRTLVSGAGLGLQLAWFGPVASLDWFMIAMRWLWGLAAPGLLAWMTWQTLKVPNTQSATGILYVAVIGTFLGELISQLLSERLSGVV